MDQFKISLNYDRIHRQMKYNFIFFWTLATGSALSFFYSMYSVNPDYLIYTVQILIPNHIIYMQAFQIFVFLRGIELRLHLFKFCDFEGKKLEVKQSLQNIFGIYKELYDCIGITCFLSCFNIFMVILINLYWLFLMYFNFNQSSLLGF